MVGTTAIRAWQSQVASPGSIVELAAKFNMQHHGISAALENLIPTDHEKSVHLHCQLWTTVKRKHVKFIVLTVFPSF